MIFKAGDEVQVRSWDEIRRTLDSEGTCDGLPFMPEMLGLVGRRFRVSRLAGRTCVEVAPLDIPVRGFRGGEVVVLEELRCSGADHDGCQRGCLLYWKAAWLRRVPRGEVPSTDNVPLAPSAASALKTRAGERRYFCQSTELIRATEKISHARVLWICLQDVLSGSRGLVETIRRMVSAVWRKWAHPFGTTFPRGPHSRTPEGALQLRVGEVVEVQEYAAIVETLDSKGRNRGLQYDGLLRRYCGQRFPVERRLERMIIESTGEMRELQNTVVLEGPRCQCAYVMGGCPRAEPVYWREIWLKRSGPG